MLVWEAFVELVKKRWGEGKWIISGGGVMREYGICVFDVFVDTPF